MKRKPIILFMQIIKVLKDGPLSLRSLDIKLNTSSQTILSYTEILQQLGILKLRKIAKGKKITTKAELTPYGRKLKL